MIVTVLPPTFNGGSLNNLYQSLQKQTIKDFEWLLVDDGSTDDTKSIAEEMRKKAEFSMRYIYKENGGKHTALNVGVKLITSELTFIVDSDDTPVPDAIETTLQYHKKYKERKDLCGYSFLRRFPDGNINGKPFEPDEKVGTYIECRINADDTQADKAEVFYTRCLKEFPFPEYRNEKFLGEDLVWIRMAMKYQMVHINRAIYVGNYLEDGLTKNRRKNNIRSPHGCMERAKEYFADGRGALCRRNIEDWKNTIQYYLQHREEADASAEKFKSFLESECSEEKYAKTLWGMLAG